VAHCVELCLRLLHFVRFHSRRFPVPRTVGRGQGGMTLAISQALTTIAGSWVWAKAPMFGRYIAQSRFAELDHAFFRSLVSSQVALVLASAAFLAACAGARHLGSSNRQPATCAETSGSAPCRWYYQPLIVSHRQCNLRAHKREPLVALSIVLGLVTTV